MARIRIEEVAWLDFVCARLDGVFDEWLRERAGGLAPQIPETSSERPRHALQFLDCVSGTPKIGAQPTDVQRRAGVYVPGLTAGASTCYFSAIDFQGPILLVLADRHRMPAPVAVPSAGVEQRHGGARIKC